MMPSGLSNTRESTSPGRMPPRARHRIWSNSQPEAWTFSARRSVSMWYSSQDTYRCLPSSVNMNSSPVVGFLMGSGLIGMAQHDGVLAVGAGRHHVDRRTDHFLDALKVAARVQRQRVPLRHAEGRLGPAGEGFVHGHAGRDLVAIERQDVDGLAVQFVADAHLDLGQAVQHVELGHAQTGDAVDDDRALQRSGIEPAAAARAAGDGPLLLADGGQVMADRAFLFPLELGRERA